MNIFQQIHAVCDAAIRITAALIKMAIGFAMLAGCAWVIAVGFTNPIVMAALGLIGIIAFIIVTTGLGAIVGPPVPHVKGSVRLETRRALRRAGMLGKRRS
jgi:hypothetical protein